MDISAKNFPYNTKAVSREQFDEHIKLYKGYIDKVNETTSKLEKEGSLSAANATYSKYRGLKKGETYALDGTILHELYFQNMTSEPSEPKKFALSVFDKYFGGADNFFDDMTACAKAARGWCVFSYEQRTDTFRNLLLDLHDYGVVSLSFPILVLDMYEHAYFMDYGTKKDDYIKQFIHSICWDTVEKRLKKLGKSY